jgi:UPF0042 nucleotide-binding protein
VNDELRFIIITGMSGAGKTQAIKFLEDLGYFCVDNLPPMFIPKFAELCRHSADNRRVAVVCDIRGGAFFNAVSEALTELDRDGMPYQILFLEASDEALVRRHKETRRRHPLSTGGRLLDAIKEERTRLQTLRGRATKIIDTSDIATSQFREELTQLFGGDGRLDRLIITVVSFGFKYGLPLDADLVFDVRFLPNPHYVDELRPLTGNDKRIADYVMGWQTTRRFMRKISDLLEFLLPHYMREGKSQLTVALGCTGGRHRSVVLANRLADQLRAAGHTVLAEHRDVGRPVVGDGL